MIGLCTLISGVSISRYWILGWVIDRSYPILNLACLSFLSHNNRVNIKAKPIRRRLTLSLVFTTTMFKSKSLTALLLAAITFAIAAETCDYYDLNFDQLARGEYVTSQFLASHGVDISCTGGSWGCRVFDSEIPYGEWDVSGAVNDCKSGACDLGDCGSKNDCGDPDLGTPNNACTNTTGYGEGNGGKPGAVGEICWSLGKLLVVDEGGPSHPPDDRVGGTMLFTFNNPVELISIDHMDNEAAEDYQIFVSYGVGCAYHLSSCWCWRVCLIIVINLLISFPLVSFLKD